MIHEPRSDCPINRSLEILGDRWSLLLLRDVALHDRRTFRDLLTGSEEGISAPMLSRRLGDLVQTGFLTKDEVARGKQGKYSLTELAMQAVPVLVELGRLGTRIDPSTAAHAPVPESEIPARLTGIRERHGLAPSAG